MSGDDFFVMHLWLPPIVSFGLTALVLWALLRSGLAQRLAMDHPNARSLHVRPIPRIGGLVAVPVALACVVAAAGTSLIMAAALVLCLLSYADDRYSLPVAVRFSAHLVVALVVSVGLPIEPAWLLPIAVLAIVWLTNLYNFMDGADGLAGGMAAFGFGALGLAAMLAGADDLATPAFAIAAAASGFLVFNTHPARIFMGDAGSIPLGFMAGAFGLEGALRGTWPLWFPLVVFSPFVADATVTLARRALRGEKVWQAHREHYYQRLVRLGWGHARVARVEYLLMLAATVLGIGVLHAGVALQTAALLAWCVVLALLMVAVDRAWAARQKAAGA